METRNAVRLDELAKELEASAEELVEQAHNTPLRSRNRRSSPSMRRAGASDDEEEEESAGDEGEDEVEEEEEGDDGEEEQEGDEDEEEQNRLLAKLEQVRASLQEALRRGKEERAAKLALLQRHRLELEHLTNTLHLPYPALPPTHSNKARSSQIVHLAGSVCLGLALTLVLLVVLNHLFVYQDRALAMYYLHPT